MSQGDYEVPLSLSNLDSGKLDEEFQEKYREATANLKEGERATFTVTVDLSRVKGTSTMFNVESRLALRMPPRKRFNACQISGDGKQLLTEKPVKENVKIVPMFGEKGAAAGE
jgi:hypothetical protein